MLNSKTFGRAVPDHSYDLGSEAGLFGFQPLRRSLDPESAPTFIVTEKALKVPPIDVIQLELLVSPGAHHRIKKDQAKYLFVKNKSAHTSEEAKSALVTISPNLARVVGGGANQSLRYNVLVGTANRRSSIEASMRGHRMSMQTVPATKNSEGWGPLANFQQDPSPEDQIRYGPSAVTLEPFKDELVMLCLTVPIPRCVPKHATDVQEILNMQYRPGCGVPLGELHDG